MEKIKLSAEKSFSLAGLQNSHLHICNILICISTLCNFLLGYLGLTVGLCASEKFGIMYLISWVLGIG